MTYYLIPIACLYLILAFDQLLNWETPNPTWVKWTCCALWPAALVGYALADLVWGES